MKQPKEIIIYQKPIITKAPENWDTMTEKEKEKFCKVVVSGNSNPEFDIFFNIKENPNFTSLERLKGNCQVI